MSKQTEILCEIVEERGRQDLLWGEQNWPLKPAGREWTRLISTDADEAKVICDKNASCGNTTWYDIWREEFLEVFVEDDPKKQREEIIQALAVGVAMVEYLDRRFPKKAEV